MKGRTFRRLKPIIGQMVTAIPDPRHPEKTVSGYLGPFSSLGLPGPVWKSFLVSYNDGETDRGVVLYTGAVIKHNGNTYVLQ